jgi:ketosteroid isomerase-like protein
MAHFDGEAFVRRFNSVWQAHDVDGIVEMFTDDVIFEASFGAEPCGERAVGKAAARKLAAAVFERVPDLHFEELRHFVSPGYAVVESVTTGTPAGGAPYEIHLADLLTLRDGKIAAKRSYRKARL